MTLPQGFCLSIKEHLCFYHLSPKAPSISFPQRASRESELFLPLGLLIIEILLYAPTHHWVSIPTDLISQLTLSYCSRCYSKYTKQKWFLYPGAFSLLIFPNYMQILTISPSHLKHQLQGLIHTQMVTIKSSTREPVASSQLHFQNSGGLTMMFSVWLAFDEVKGQGCQVSCTRKSCPMLHVTLTCHQTALVRRLSWLDYCPTHQEVVGLIPGQDTYSGCRFNPHLGCIWEATD